jgi:hypothetical protein
MGLTQSPNGKGNLFLAEQMLPFLSIVDDGRMQAQ